MENLRAKVETILKEQPNIMPMQLCRHLGVPEAEILRVMPGGWAVELDIRQWEKLIRSLETLGNVHVIVTNAAATLESVGTFGNFTAWGEFFNVQTKLDMHIRGAQLGAAFAVDKPGHQAGINILSIQFFDKAGSSAFKVFLSMGAAAVPAEKAARFAAIREQFRMHF